MKQQVRVFLVVRAAPGVVMPIVGYASEAEATWKAASLFAQRLPVDDGKYLVHPIEVNL